MNDKSTTDNGKGKFEIVFAEKAPEYAIIKDDVEIIGVLKDIEKAQRIVNSANLAAMYENLAKALRYAKRTIDEMEEKFPEQAHNCMGVDEMIFVEQTLEKIQ